MNKRNYNPLTEGYTGSENLSKEKQAVSSKAPLTLPKIQSGVTISLKSNIMRNSKQN